MTKAVKLYFIDLGCIESFLILYKTNLSNTTITNPNMSQPNKKFKIEQSEESEKLVSDWFDFNSKGLLALVKPPHKMMAMSFTTCG